jgi:hypothetical protein
MTVSLHRNWRVMIPSGVFVKRRWKVHENYRGGLVRIWSVAEVLLSCDSVGHATTSACFDINGDDGLSEHSF